MADKIPQKLLENGDPILKWERHSHRYNKWKKTLRRTFDEFMVECELTAETQTKFDVAVAEGNVPSEELERMRHELTIQRAWTDSFRTDFYWIKKQSNLELRRKQRIQVQLKKKKLNVTMKAVKNLKDFLASERYRGTKGLPTLGGQKSMELLALADTHLEENDKDWPPEEGELESDSD